MRLAHLSDTHGFHRGMGAHGNADVPEADVLIHSGDYSRDFGSWMDTIRFAHWMADRPHEHKILCPGNHDYAVWENPAKAATLFREHGIHMIGQEPLEIDGVVFDGGPWMPLSGWDPKWGFEMEKEELENAWARIEKVDVLITHTPPMGILDRTARNKHIGCPVLRRRVFELKPEVHCFGHVHEARGTHQEQGINFINGSSNTRGTFVRDDINGITHMTMGIQDAYLYEMNERHD